MRSHLLHGKVRHRRSKPIDYELEHDVFYVALDLDELEVVDRRLRLFSHGRPNVPSFRDHWLPAPPICALPFGRTWEIWATIPTGGA